MPHTIATLSPILDDLRAPLQNVIGQKIKARAWIAKSRLKGGGKQVLQPVIVADDTGMDWIGDGGAVAAASGGDPIELTIPYRFFAARFRITGPTIAAAGQDESQIENATQWAMTRLAESVASALNRDAWSGGRSVGFLNERVNKAGGNDLWEFSGDAQKVADLVVANGGNINADVIRLDTYATVANVAISAADATGGTITVVGALNTAAVGDGFAMGVRVTTAGLGLDLEPAGIYENFINPTHFGVDRTTAAGTALLQANVLTIGVVDGNNTRADVTLRRIQVVLDRISERTRGQGKITRAFIHPSMRDSMAALFNAAATMRVDVVGSGEMRIADGGFAGFSYAGIKFEEDVDCGRGMIVVVQDDTWSWYALKEGDWDTTGGGPLYQVQGSDAVEAVWKEYQNLGCFGPNFNGALVGLTFPGEVGGDA